MSKIEWTEKTWNPTIGCTEVSPGCTNCYAARMTWRLASNFLMGTTFQDLAKKLPNGRIVWTGDVKFIEERLTLPARSMRPTTFFVDSMSDLFHPEIPFAVIAQVFAVMLLCPQHTFQVLTKRPERAKAFYELYGGGYWKRLEEAALEVIKAEPSLFLKSPTAPGEESFLRHLMHDWIMEWDEDGQIERLLYIGADPFPNIWIGASVEDQKAADERIPHLIEIPAAVRFLSCEPLLGPVNLHRWLCVHATDDHPEQQYCNICSPADNIQWVIAGGESGPRARPMHPEWPIGLLNQCQDAGVPFFFKQHGEWIPGEQEGVISSWISRDGKTFIDHLEPGWVPDPGMYAVRRVGKKKAGRQLQGQEWSQMPEINKAIPL